MYEKGVEIEKLFFINCHENKKYLKSFRNSVNFFYVKNENKQKYFLFIDIVSVYFL